MKTQNVKVTTTSGFDGVAIEEYLEPITAHVVVGMNFFKDFLGGLTDIFGGKSDTYQNTLSSINNEVIQQLRKKAYSIGGNCVLGLKIDNDEISAQGKSMMMVTAMGTAAKADFENKLLDIPKETKYKSISNELLNILKIKKKYILGSENDSIDMNEEFWEFAKNNKADELASYIITKYIDFVENTSSFYTEDLTKFANNVNDYFLLIDSDISIRILYDKLLNESRLKVRKSIIEIITESGLIDYHRIISLIESSEFSEQKAGLQLSVAEKLSYEKSDIQSIDEIISLISSTFVERGEKTTRKKALSSKVKEIWKCECFRENDINEYCSQCGKDIFGFTEKELKHEVVVERLTNVVTILKRVIE